MRKVYKEGDRCTFETSYGLVSFRITRDLIERLNEKKVAEDTMKLQKVDNMKLCMCCDFEKVVLKDQDSLDKFHAMFCERHKNTILTLSLADKLGTQLNKGEKLK